MNLIHHLKQVAIMVGVITFLTSLLFTRYTVDGTPSIHTVSVP